MIKKRHNIDSIFVLFLYGMFALLSLLLVLFGARIYGHVVNEASNRSNTRSTLFFVTNKIRAADSAGNIYIENTKDMLERAKSMLETSIASSLEECYSNEGIYPQEITYLEEEYELRIDRDRFSVSYNWSGSDIYPDVQIAIVEEFIDILVLRENPEIETLIYYFDGKIREYLRTPNDNPDGFSLNYGIDLIEVSAFSFKEEQDLIIITTSDLNDKEYVMYVYKHT